MRNNKKIKVGIFILSNVWGGAEESIYKIAKNLNKDQFTVYLLVNDFLYKNYKGIPGVKRVNLGQLESNKKLQKILSLLKIRSKLIKVITKNKIQLIHAQLENTVVVLGLTFKKITIPIIFTLRGTETQIYHNPRTFEHKVIRYYIEKLFKEEKVKITSVTKWLTKDFNNNYRQKIDVFYNGVDLKKFRHLDKKKRQKFILFVGRYIERKGIEELLKVAAKHREFEFWFAGKGQLGYMINLPNTKDLGFIKRDDLVELYNNAAICVFPSRFEAFGNVCLEAMSCGAPIVATDTGFSEYVKNGEEGLIVQPYNVLQLEKSIVKLMNDEKLRNYLGRNAREKAKQFDVKQTIKKYEDLYREVANRKSN